MGKEGVKSGEELQDLFTSPNALFIGVCKGWVKSEEYFNKFFTCTFKNCKDTSRQNLYSKFIYLQVWNLATKTRGLRGWKSPFSALY